MIRNNNTAILYSENRKPLIDYKFIKLKVIQIKNL